MDLLPVYILKKIHNPNEHCYITFESNTYLNTRIYATRIKILKTQCSICEKNMGNQVFILDRFRSDVKNEL